MASKLDINNTNLVSILNTINSLPTVGNESMVKENCTVSFSIEDDTGMGYLIMYSYFKNNELIPAYRACSYITESSIQVAKNSYIFVMRDESDEVDDMWTTGFDEELSYRRCYTKKIISNSQFSIRVVDCCFIPGTQILISLNGNTKAIETFQENDDIVAYDIYTDSYYIAKVKALIVNRNTTDIAEVYFENGQSLTMNAYHPIYTNEGFHSLTGYQGYDILKIGDIVKTNEGWTKIIDIKRYNSEPIITYNIDVINIDEITDDEINDTFIANGIVVHNAGCAV